MSDKGLPYGPATVAIRRFLQRLAALDANAERDVVRHYEALSATDEFRRAELAMAMAVAEAGRVAERDSIAGPLIQIVRTRESQSDELVQQINISANNLRPIAEPALGAILALLMRDTLTATQMQILYEPFASLIRIDTLG